MQDESADVGLYDGDIFIADTDGPVLWDLLDAFICKTQTGIINVEDLISQLVSGMQILQAVPDLCRRMMFSLTPFGRYCPFGC